MRKHAYESEMYKHYLNQAKLSKYFPYTKLTDWLDVQDFKFIRYRLAQEHKHRVGHLLGKKAANLWLNRSPKREYI